MSLQTWEEALVTGQTAGTALNTSITATSIIPSGAKYTLPANFFNIGKSLKITVTGSISNIVTAPGTLTLDVRFGSIVVFNGGAMQLSTTAHVTVPFYAEVLLTCRAIGPTTSANLIGQGRITSQALSLTSTADSATTPATLLLPNTAPAVGTGFDSTTSQTIDFFATFNTSNIGNQIQVQQFIVEAMN